MLPNVVYWDLESTSLDVDNARIVEFAFHSERGSLVRRVNPGVPIPAEATAVHGIKDEDVAACPAFGAYAETIQRAISGRVLAGFVSRRFDSLLLDAELRRAGCQGLDRDAAGRIVQAEIDLYQIWIREEPRKLVDAARRFAGIDLTELAHSAAADTEALVPTLEGMIAAFALEGLSVEELCARSVPDGEVDRAGRFKRDDQGIIRFAFGKHFGEPAVGRPSFLEWLLTKDFNEDTKAVARSLLEMAYARAG